MYERYLNICSLSKPASDPSFSKPFLAPNITRRTLQIISCKGVELYFLCFECFSKMGQQMLERGKKERKRRRTRKKKKNSQGKLFALQCGLRGERKSGREGSKETASPLFSDLTLQRKKKIYYWCSIQIIYPQCLQNDHKCRPFTNALFEISQH